MIDRFHPKPGFRLALLSTLFALAVVMLGAFTRLVDAGLGCPDWPGCYGHLWAPNTAHEIAQANHLYPDHQVDLRKTWPEMLHRYLASTLGLLIVLLCGYAWRWRAQKEYPHKHCYALLTLVVVQGLFGMWTVTLKLWPQVVVAHLLGGMATLSLLALLTLRLSGCTGAPLRRPDDRRTGSRCYRWAGLLLAALLLQVSLGGWTSANYAALACPDLPRCHQQWWPQMDFAQGFDVTQSIGPNYLGGQLEGPARTAIHVSHRLGAALVTLLAGVLMYQLWCAGLQAWAFTLFTLINLQLSLGIANIVLGLPLAIAVLHNAVAAVLVATTLLLTYWLRGARHA